MDKPDSGYRLDDVDRRILYALMDDARNATAASIADKANVSGGTVRNRIQNLEEHGIIRGYSAHVDFEQAGGKLSNLYLCNVPVDEREPLTNQARAIPGVVHVRSLMTGRRNLHVLAIGEDTEDLQRVARSLSQLGIEIEDEDLVEDDYFSPYRPFNPDASDTAGINDVISLTGDANIVELAVTKDAAIAGTTLEAASQQNIIDDDTLVIGIERDETELTPHGDTVVKPYDIVTVLSRSGADANALDVFRSPSPNQPSESTQ
ncbi:MAG: winged helix-turn-helix transcriptional regulator [Salinirussus sp.]